MLLTPLKKLVVANMPIWSIYEINSCRYKAKKFGGSAVDFCSACFKIDGINDKTLRMQLKREDIQLEGSCERLAASTGANPAAGTAQDTTRKRKQRVPLAEIQEPTVKLHFERAKPGNRKSKKRRWSVEESKRAAAVIKRTMTKGRTMKADLKQQIVAFVAGAEKVVVPKKKTTTNDGKQNISKATQYCTARTGAAMINGVSCLLGQENPTAFRASMVLASLSAQPSLDAKSHPGNQATNARFSSNVEETR